MTDPGWAFAPTGGADPAVWSTEAWLAEATAWIDAALTAHGRRRTGPVEQPRIRPWGTVLHAETESGMVWMKAGAAGTAFEATLYELLAAAVPEHVLVPLAVDAARGWVLLPDGGAALAEAAAGDGQLPDLARALGGYAELQLTLTPRADDLVALGVVDMRPAILPQRLDEALEVTAAFAHRRGAGNDTALHAQVAALAGTVARWSQELAASPVGSSLDHNDLHAANIFVSGRRPQFYDWGDSVVAHPFASMLTTLTATRDVTLGCLDDDPRLFGLRDAYLEPFAAAHRATVSELVPTLELACRLGRIARTLVWQRAIDSCGHDVPQEWERAPLATLLSLLAESPYGGA